MSPALETCTLQLLRCVEVQRKESPKKDQDNALR